MFRLTAVGGLTGSLLLALALGAPDCRQAGAAKAADGEAQQAAEVLQATGVQGGLIVHLGCGDGRLAAALAAQSRCLVHGLDSPPENVRQAREHFLARGLAGRASADVLRGAELPYADNLVNLLVVEKSVEIPQEELLRVLAPGGVALLRQDAGWTTLRKDWPTEIDQWTHYLHDASNNAVARDQRVGSPRHVQWQAGPLWSRSHEFNSSLSAMVTAGGRLYYIFDEGLTGVTPPFLPERWTLTARDALNGVLLWKRPLPELSSRHWRNRALRSVPKTVMRRLVAADDRVYVTLSYDGPVSVLDGATGRVLTAYEDTAGADELRWLDGVLLSRTGDGRLVAVDTTSGETLWQLKGRWQPLALAAEDGRVFFQDHQSLGCCALRTGELLWEVDCRANVGVLVASGDKLLISAGDFRALSATDGKLLWSQQMRLPRNELFVTGDRAWHWNGDRIAGRDLATGRLVAQVDTSEVFTRGHHFRCYPSKATERFLITPNRGAEFVSLAGEPSFQNDWIRGACIYGVMPGNGLLYAPPDPCFCYPGVKVNGLNALAAADEALLEQLQARGADPNSPERIERGGAFGSVDAAALSGAQAAPGDWPTYRHDARRSGATGAQVAVEPAPEWRVKLGGRLTPPVVCGGRVFVASKSAHTLFALDAASSKRLWHFTAGGPIDSPPTIVGPLAIFGCADGWVYCLRAADGELVWRYRAAPLERRIVAFDHLESPWRVHGSVLVLDGVVYCTAGRSSYLDGGIWVYGLDACTGKVRCHTRIDTWSRTREDARGKPFVPGYYMEGALSDILVSQDGFIFLGQYQFDPNLTPQEAPYYVPGPDERVRMAEVSEHPYAAGDAADENEYERHQREWLERNDPALLKELRQRFGGFNVGAREMGLHLLATSGFLDDSWFNRTYWMYSRHWPGYYIAHLAPKTGQLLIVGPERTYALQSYPTRNLQSPLFTPGQDGYVLMADRNENEPVLDERTIETTKGWGFGRREPPVWCRRVPVRVRAMVLSGEHLVVAGPPDVVPEDDPMAAFDGRLGAVLAVCSAADGQTLSEQKLTAVPVFDGMIAAGGRLYLSLADGTMVCLGSPPDKKGK